MHTLAVTDPYYGQLYGDVFFKIWMRSNKFPIEFELWRKSPYLNGPPRSLQEQAFHSITRLCLHNIHYVCGIRPHSDLYILHICTIIALGIAVTALSQDEKLINFNIGVWGRHMVTNLWVNNVWGPLTITGTKVNLLFVRSCGIHLIVL